VFLLNALQTVYGIREQEAQSIVDALEIIHPYGVIDPSVQFGTTRAHWVQLAEGIKTYTEQVGAGDVVSRVETIIHRADHIVFLGFAYHDQNMQLLKPAKQFSASKSIFGTAFGMSDSDVNVVGGQIDSWFKGRDARIYRKDGMINIENKLKCVELFDHYAKSLTGGR
jgi:Zn-dependent alcohol dehydrogenase